MLPVKYVKSTCKQIAAMREKAKGLTAEAHALHHGADVMLKGLKDGGVTDAELSELLGK